MQLQVEPQIESWTLPMLPVALHTPSRLTAPLAPLSSPQVRDLTRPEAQLTRRQLGFPRLRNLLESMPDVVAVVPNAYDEAPPLHPLPPGLVLGPSGLGLEGDAVWDGPPWPWPLRGHTVRRSECAGRSGRWPPTGSGFRLRESSVTAKCTQTQGLDHR